MDASQNRINNFLDLFRQFRDANAELPNRGLLKLFAEKVDVSNVYLSHVKCGRKQIGAAIARKIEAKCGKPHGWMDQQHDDGEAQSSEERMLVEQILIIYRNTPGTVKRLITDAIKKALEPKAKEEPHPPG